MFQTITCISKYSVNVLDCMINDVMFEACSYLFREFCWCLCVEVSRQVARICRLRQPLNEGGCRGPALCWACLPYAAWAHGLSSGLAMDTLFDPNPVGSSCGFD